MRFTPSLLAALVGLTGLVMPTIALSATEANDLYAGLMAKTPEQREEAAALLEEQDRRQLFISRINAYRATKKLEKQQDPRRIYRAHRVRR
jgi:hypothetical protein